MSDPYPPITYNQYNRPEADGLDSKGMKTRTKMEFAAEADINTIMRRYTQTGEIPEGITGVYGDFSEAPDFVEAQIVIARADAQFSSLPAEVRGRFDNDPVKFLEFVHQEGNLEELQKMGLLSKEASDRLDAVKAPVAPDTTTILTK